MSICLGDWDQCNNPSHAEVLHILCVFTLDASRMGPLLPITRPLTAMQRRTANGEQIVCMKRMQCKMYYLFNLSAWVAHFLSILVLLTRGWLSCCYDCNLNMLWLPHPAKYYIYIQLRFAFTVDLERGPRKREGETDGADGRGDLRRRELRIMELQPRSLLPFVASPLCCVVSCYTGCPTNADVAVR